MKRFVGTAALLVAGLLCLATLARAANGPQLGSVDWVKTTDASGSPNVRFHLHWVNPIRESPTVPVQGTIKSQEFGVFLPDFGPIGEFLVPPIAPDSFFDVFFEVPLSQLPPEPEKRIPAMQSPSAAGRAAGPNSALDVPCSPDTIWAGNVDIVWSGTGVSGQVLKHYGDLPVCPGGGPSYIHVRSTDCPIGAPWSVSAPCPGFSATLVNEDLSPAPNPIPPGWTGFIAVTATAAVPAGTVCCFLFHFDCDTRPADLYLCATACPCNTQPPKLQQVDWHNIGNAVRFHLRWLNESPNATSPPVQGMMHSQEFGVFMPDFGSIGGFNVPPLAPNSFFDVFFDVPLDALPPEPMKILPGGVPATAPASARTAAPNSVASVPCPPDTIWDGNVDIIWNAAGTVGQIQRHYGDLVVCPGGGPSLIHVRSTTCTVAAPWSVLGLCPGFSATLLNEDHSPAPNPIPPGWTGFISVTATAAVASGTVCCFDLHFDCAGAPADIELCATACDCGPGHGPTLGQVDWHTIGTMERFHLRWENPSANTPTIPVDGSIKSQEFGVFLPDFGPIGDFSVPPIAPNSFFDVFVDVPLAQLPVEPLQVVPGGGPTPGAPCPSDTIWDGNVDIIWSGASAAGQVQRHFGDLIVCPGSGASYIHFKSTTCPGSATWSVTGLCPGFNVTLVNEDFSAAPNPIPAGWTGFLLVTAAAGTVPGTTCCFTVNFDCGGSPAALELCATACECANGASTPPTGDLDFGIRTAMPNPAHGPVLIAFVIPHTAATTVRIYDASGHRVRTLQDAPLAAGRHVIQWDGRTESGRPAAAGTYFVQLMSGGRSASRKLAMMR